MPEPKATIVVVPRERFSCVPGALASVYEETDVPFRLVYVDGGSPRRIQRYLEEQAAERGFDLIRRDRYLSPNEARNIGHREVSTEYAVFLDNDVWVTRGWLERLVACADETGAAVVGPLTCIGDPQGQEIHVAGGEVAIREDPVNGSVRRHAHERMWHPGKQVSSVQSELRRTRCTLAEFHCMLVRKSILDEIGGFDEGMLNTREHLDFCLEVMKAGGEIYFEPDSVVTYVPGPPFKLFDVPFYMLRWSDAWERRSLEHFREKWDLSEDEFFKRRYERLGWRRYMSLVRPASRRVTMGRRSRILEGALKRGDRVLNRYITSRHDRAASKLGS